MGKFTFFLPRPLDCWIKAGFSFGTHDPPEKFAWICGRSIRCRLVESTRTGSCFMKIGKVVEGARWFHDLLWILNLVLCQKSYCKCNVICTYTYWHILTNMCMCAKKILCTYTVYKGFFSTSWWWYLKILMEPPNILGPHEVTQHVLVSTLMVLVFFGPQDFWHLHHKRIV